MDILSLIIDSDSYKTSHWVQYPPNTTEMFSYFESRGSDNKTFTHSVFFGLQYYLKEYLSKPITIDQVNEAQEFCNAHGVPFNYDGWKYIVEKHDGYLPVRIKAVPEGSVIPLHNILLSVESTDPEVFWVVSYIETLLVRLWYPITVATQSYFIKQDIQKFAEMTCDPDYSGVNFQLHDFGGRGVTCREQAMIGGAAHLVNFRGSDTMAGIWMANKYYNCYMSGFSIPASEHSTITMWGKDRETDAYRNMLEKYKDSYIFACVSDSYDIYNAVENIWGGELRDQVLARDGFVVVRPDSGDPIQVVSKIIDVMAERFGYTVNSKGYKVLNHVRIIQGDGVDANLIKGLLTVITKKGYSSENLNFGSGGALLQKMNRDTLKFAFKCSYAKVDGKDVEVFKTPITDPGKNSKTGKLDLYGEFGKVATTEGPASTSLMETVFENGKILKEYTFDEIRDNSKKQYIQYIGWMDMYTIQDNGGHYHYVKRTKVIKR